MERPWGMFALDLEQVQDFAAREEGTTSSSVADSSAKPGACPTQLPTCSVTTAPYSRDQPAAVVTHGGRSRHAAQWATG